MDDYTRKMMRIAVAQTCLNVGWSTIHTSPLEILTDLLSNYILGLCKRANNYAFLFNQTEPNLDHLALAFQDMGVSIPELEEFVNYFDISGCPEVPQYPIPKDSNLNFLKPGSREVVTRPVHIHEHLPPMYPHLEEQETATVKTESTPPPEHSAGASSSGGEPVVVSPNTGGLKRRSDNPSESFAMRRARALAEEETRTLREISSVMMTTSGFLSHAREGKLPEVRTIPIVDSEPEEEVPAPPPPPPPPPPPELKPEPQLPPPEVVKPEKKKKKKSHGEVIKKEKEKPSKDDVLTALQHLLPSKAVSIHPIPPDDSQIKKLATQKETSKLKVLKPGATKTIAVMPDSFHSTPKPEKKHKPKRPNSPAAAVLTQSPIIPPKLKIPKLEKNPIKERINDELPIDPFADIKLTAEPDKQKLNIFKKISKVKDDHDDIKMEVDDFVPTKSIKDLPIHDVVKKCPATTSVAIDVMKEDKEVEASMDIENLHSPTAFGAGVFGDELMPGTPTTPRTPDIPKIATDSKKKNREKHKEKKDRDKFNVATSPVSSRICDIDNMKPKTPEVIVDTVDEGLPPFPFLSYPTGPALIPPNLASNPLIPQMNLMPFGPRLLPPPVSLIPSQLKDMLPSVPLPTSSPALTITMTPSPATSSNVSTPATTPLSKKKDKKGKKNKDKIKKKKDKKEKIKSKEKSEKKKLKLQKKQKLQEKLKMKKEKKYKKKENQIQEEKRGDSPSVPKITFKLGPEPQREISPSPKITFKPLIKKEDDAPVEISKKHSSDVSAGTTSKHHKSSSKSAKASSTSNSHSEGRSHHQKGGDSMGGTSKTTGHHQVSSKLPVAPVLKEEPVEIAESNQLWICPACGRPDDGSPMIACDACDMWYHYVCVGIQDAPESDWFCQGCISKRPDLVDKKKKHKKKK